MLNPVVTVMVKAARAGGNVLLRSINKLDAPPRQTDDAFAVEMDQGTGDACTPHTKQQR